MKKKFSYLLKGVKKNGEHVCRHEPTLEELEFFEKQGVGVEPTIIHFDGMYGSGYDVEYFRYFLLEK